MRRPDLRKWTGTTRFSPRPRRVGRVRKYLFEATGSYIENNAGLLESRQSGRDVRPRPEQRRHAARAGDADSTSSWPGRSSIDRAATIPIGGYSSQPGAALHAGRAALVRLDAGRRARQLLRRRQDDDHRQRRAFQPDQPDPVQPAMSINRVELPYGRFTATQAQGRVVYTLTPDFRRRAGAVQLQHPAGRHQSPLALEVHPGQRAVRRLHRRARRHRAGLPDLNNRALRGEVGAVGTFLRATGYGLQRTVRPTSETLEESLRRRRPCLRGAEVVIRSRPGGPASAPTGAQALDATAGSLAWR